MLSLVTTCYNKYDRFLPAWAKAVASGSNKPDEVIVVISGNGYDPESIERTKDLLGDLVRVIYIPHVCMGNARNMAVREANCKWVMHVGVDDVVMPNGIRDIRRNLSEDIVVGAMEWINHPTKSGIREYEITRESILDGGMTNDHAAFRKSMWEKSPYIEYSGDVDTAFWLGLVQAGAGIKCISEVITKHWFSADSVFGQFSREDKAEIKRMRAIWRVEGVHSPRFNSPEYKPRGDFGFTHKTITVPVSIILPFRSDNGGVRDRQMKWAVDHYKAMFPDYEVIVAEDNSGDVGWGTFNKSKVINDGVAHSHGEVLFITDIDLVYIKNKLLKSFEIARDHSLVFPFNCILFLNEVQTARILKGHKGWQFPVVDTSVCGKKPRNGIQPNGSYVMTRETYYKAGGHDERFIGWGSEDSAFIKAATTMSNKPFIRLDSYTMHLFHPTVPTRFAERDTSEKPRIMKEYLEAYGNQDKMKELLDSRYCTGGNAVVKSTYEDCGYDSVPDGEYEIPK
jgi:hypothetical protein